MTTGLILVGSSSIVHFDHNYHCHFLAITCPDGTNYTSCGRACSLTCVDVLMGTTDSPCDDKCVEACECPDGQVLDDDICVEPQQCGCFVDGFYYSVSSSEFVKHSKYACDVKTNLYMHYTLLTLKYSKSINLNT